MPIYEYRCAQCGHKLETLQKFSDAPLTTCPACGKEALSKLVSAAGFQLKGSGWYQTDFRGGSKPAAKSESGGEAPKSDAAPTPSTSSDSSATSSTTSDKASAPASTPSPSTPAAS